ncbi:MAG: PHP domain-containing protein, partial [Oscillospiraceae bacterium]|nr:PHP domain-containing protein [Oscillospiraceae bacterium]
MTDFSNFHNHTTYADGANSCEEMITAAIANGYRAFGISEHSHTSAPNDSGNLTPESMPKYFAEMRALREKYADKIELFIGIEQDALGDLPTDGADYVVGSTHFVRPNGEYRFVDYGTDGQRETVENFYGGDWYAFAEDYFRLEAQVANITKCNIVGHFDLINKNNEGDCLFDPSHPRYRAAAIAA